MNIRNILFFETFLALAKLLRPVARYLPLLHSFSLTDPVTSSPPPTPSGSHLISVVLLPTFAAGSAVVAYTPNSPSFHHRHWLV